jgi:hypothetical protein
VAEASFRSGDPSAPATDYDRACDIDDWLGVLYVGPAEGLVLGDEPAATAWWPEARAAGTPVRWIAAESDDVLIRHLARIPGSISMEDRTSYTVEDSPLFLFDAALPGRELEAFRDEERLTVRLTPGRYSVLTATYTPDDETELVLHRMLWAPP